MPRVTGRPTDDLPDSVERLVVGADHVDVKQAVAALTLGEFVAAMADWRPWWGAALFRVRVLLAHLIRLDRPSGLDRARGTVPSRFGADDVPMRPGESIGFFTVVDSQEGRFLLVEADDNHLTGYLAVVADPLSGGRNRFRLVTIVRYKRRAGRFYFDVVRPFHHLVVGAMARAGARGPRSSTARP